MKKKVDKKKIDGEQFIDKDTGETLSSFAPGVKSMNVVDPELVIMHSDEYVIIDSKAMQYIQENFSPADLGRILKMTDMTYGEYNILYNSSIPHSTLTLMETLEYSRNKFANFMNRLEKKSVIYYIIGYRNEKKVKYIMLNPYLARKRKTIHKDCLTSFEDIKTKLI
jgi:hypothetical protein